MTRLAVSMTSTTVALNVTETSTESPGAIDVGSAGLAVIAKRAASAPVMLNASAGNASAAVPVLVILIFCAGLAPAEVGSLKTICDLSVVAFAPGVIGR